MTAVNPAPQPMPGRALLDGKTVVVTAAAGTGIGFATARRCAEEGATVLLSDLHEKRLARCADELAEAIGRAVPRIVCDVRSNDSVAALFDAAAAEVGGIDVLVNNAGLGRKAPVGSAPTEPWREMLEVNVLGLLIATREAIQDMERRGVAGHVVNVSSMAGHRIPGPDSAVYGATKFAVRGLTEGLRQELRSRDSPIRVTAVSPGYVDTEFADVFGNDPASIAQMRTRIKMLEAEDVAATVLWAVSQPPHVEVHDVLMRPTRQRN